MSYFNHANDTFDTVIRNSNGDRGDDSDSDAEEDETVQTIVRKKKGNPKPEKIPVKKDKMATKKNFKVKHPHEDEDAEDEEEDEKEDEYYALPHFSGMASHNVSAGEEDANQGTEDALVKFNALSIHASPELKVHNFPPIQQSLYMKEQMRKKHPSYATMVSNAIEVIDPKKGASIIAIKKYIQGTYPDINTATISANMRRAIKRGMEDDTFKRPKGSSAILGTLAGRIVLGSGKKSLTLKSKIQKKNSKKVRKPSDEAEAKVNKPETASKSTSSNAVDIDPVTKPGKKTNLKETASKAKQHEAVPEVDEVPEDEVLENKENLGPEKVMKKKLAPGKKPAANRKPKKVVVKDAVAKKPKEVVVEDNVDKNSKEVSVKDAVVKDADAKKLKEVVVKNAIAKEVVVKNAVAKKPESVRVEKAPTTTSETRKPVTRTMSLRSAK